MIASLSAGVVFGLSAGFAPGPLLMLVISQTVRHGVREGFKVALAPLVTDLPIIIVCMFVLTRLAGYRGILGLVSIAGGLFVVYLAYESFRTTAPGTSVHDNAPQSLGKGVLVNALSPHPYLFWLTVGAPFIIKAWGTGRGAATAFVAGFYVCLIGAKMAVAAMAGTSRQLLTGDTYRNIMRVLGLLLLVFAFLLIRDGVALLGA
jgi:threonine/homoserine/homoserine lactone efflux protein